MIAMTAQARLALAQFALLGCVVEPKAQTNKRMMPTKGMAAKNIVKNHSPKLTSLLVELDWTMCSPMIDLLFYVAFIIKNEIYLSNIKKCHVNNDKSFSQMEKISLDLLMEIIYFSSRYFFLVDRVDRSVFNL
jgi:hypothetical protein